MVVEVTLRIDLSTGDYDTTFTNISNPGEAMDLVTIRKAVNLVLGNIETGESEPTMKQ